MASKRDRVEIYRSKKVKGQFGWRYVAANGKKIAIGGELYKRKSNVLKMVEKLFGDKIHAWGYPNIVDTTQ